MKKAFRGCKHTSYDHEHIVLMVLMFPLPLNVIWNAHFSVYQLAIMHMKYRTLRKLHHHTFQTCIDLEQCWANIQTSFQSCMKELRFGCTWTCKLSSKTIPIMCVIIIGLLFRNWIVHHIAITTNCYRWIFAWVHSRVYLHDEYFCLLYTDRDRDTTTGTTLNDLKFLPILIIFFFRNEGKLNIILKNFITIYAIYWRVPSNFLLRQAL